VIEEETNKNSIMEYPPNLSFALIWWNKYIYSLLIFFKKMKIQKKERERERKRKVTVYFQTKYVKRK